MTKWDPDLSDIPIDEAITLVVASRTRQGLSAHVVDLKKSAMDALRESCKKTLEELDAGEAVPFGPDVYLETGEYLAVPDEVVPPEHPVRSLLRTAGTLDQLSGESIPRLWFYAVLVGDDPEARHAFIRKTDPHIVAKTGRILMTLGDALTVIDQPVFIIEEKFDVVTVEGGLAVLNLTPFEILFRQVEGLEARVEVWVTAISENVTVTPKGLELLTEATRKNTKLARKLRSIHDSGHLANVEVAKIREFAGARGLEVDHLFDGDTLVIDEATDVMGVLRLLNEDLFEGGLTTTEFAADRKRAL